MSRYLLATIQKERMIQHLRNQGVVVGYLFGSYARGTAGPLSDIDIGVVFSKTISENEQENRIEMIRVELEKLFGTDKVDIINVPQVKKPLLRFIITLGEGKILFSDDKKLENSLAFYARREFEDTKSLRRIQSEAMRKSFA